MKYKCNVCNGIGSFHGLKCSNCANTGKVDWIRRIVRKSSITHVFVWACINGNLDKVKRLEVQGVDIHIYNDVALRWAILNGRLEIIKYLVKQGLNLHIYEGAALQHANKHGHLEVIKYLKHMENIRRKLYFVNQPSKGENI